MWAVHLDCKYWGFHSTSTITTRAHPLLPSYRLKFPLKCSRVFLHLLVYGVDVVCPRSPSGVRNRPVSQFGDDGWRESCNWPWTSETRPSCPFVLYSHHYPGVTERCLLLRCWILTKSKLSDSLGAPWLPADEARLRMGLNLPRLPKYRIVELSNVHQLDAFSKGIRDASGALVNTWNWRTWFIPLFVVGDDTGVTSHIIIVIPATCNSNCHGCPNYCHSQQTAVYRRKPAQQDFHNQPNGYSYTHTRFKARYYSYLLGFYPLHLKLFFKSTERLSCRWSRPRSD